MKNIFFLHHIYAKMDNKEYEDFYESRKKALRKIYMEFNYEDLLMHADLDMGVPKVARERFSEYVKRRRKCFKQRWKYILFTINFKENVRLDIIKKKTMKCLSKTWIVDSYHRYECRGVDEDDEYKGIHLHFWCEIKENKNTYACKREVYNTFKDCVGNKQHVNCRYANDNTNFDTYTRGYKKGEPKEHYELDQELNDYIKLNL